MGRIIVVMVLGTALFFAGAWYLGLFNDEPNPGSGSAVNQDATKPQVTAEDKLGADLYSAAAFPPYKIPKRGTADPIVLHGIMNPRDQEEVPSQINGRVLFIGEEINPEIAVLAGSAALLAEPNYVATVQAGRQTFLKFYRRLYEGQIVHQDQMVAMIEPAKALGTVLEKIAKIEASKAEATAAEATEKEAKIRYETNQKLYAKGAVPYEELRGSELTWIKTKYERVAKEQAIQLATIDKDQADIELRLHEIRPLLPFRYSVIKNIQKQQGFAVKQGDPILTVQNLERLQAEAQIELPYFTRFKDHKKFTATIEPTVLGSPLHELSGHARDITSVAVSKDMKIVSGSEDHTVCVWTQDALAPLWKLDHDDAVEVVVCTPVNAQKNLCLAGCLDGSIWIWNLEGDKAGLIKKIEHAHGKEASITSLAFSPDGNFFASGALDGTIKIWTTSDGKEKYPFKPEFGVAQCHEDKVTSLHFTPQARLVSAGRDKTLRVWKLKQEGAVADGKAIPFRGGNVPNLDVSQDGKWMLFDLGRTLQLLSVQTRQPVHSFSTPANSTPFDTLALFSPDGSMLLTAGAPEGRLQLWRATDAESPRGYEVRQFATKGRSPVTCAAFSPKAGQGGLDSFAVSASGLNLYLWSIPTLEEVKEQRIRGVPLTLTSHNVDSATGQIRIGFEVPNPVILPQFPSGRFEAGRTVTIVID